MKKIKEVFVNSFVFYLAIDLVEELLEEIFAFGITWVFAKAISTFAVVVITTGGKTIFKSIVKRITYKEGNDKMKAIQKFGQWIKGNYKPLLGTASAAVTALGGTGVIDVMSLPALDIAGFNITPILFYIVFGVLSILGISQKGWRTVATALAEAEIEAEVKHKKHVQITAKKRVKAEAKEAKLSQAAQEKKTAKEAADKAKQEAKKQADDAFEAEVQAQMAEIKKAQAESANKASV